MKLTRQQKEALKLVEQQGGITQSDLVEQGIYSSQPAASRATEILVNRNWLKEKKAPSNERSSKVYTMTQHCEDIYELLVQNLNKSEKNGSI